jgi:hypothetical protein
MIEVQSMISEGPPAATKIYAAQKKKDVEDSTTPVPSEPRFYEAIYPAPSQSRGAPRSGFPTKAKNATLRSRLFAHGNIFWEERWRIVSAPYLLMQDSDSSGLSRKVPSDAGRRKIRSASLGALRERPKEDVVQDCVSCTTEESSE